MSLTANATPIPILVYHQISAAPPKGAPFRSLYVTPQRFRLQMALLRAMGFRALSMGDLQPFLLGKKKGKVLGLTFDDGYVNNLEHALPVLNEYGFSSTCYAVSALSGKTNLWDKDIGIEQVSLMNHQQMREWVNAGQEIGAHTRHHVHLAAQQDAAARDEIWGCKSELESQLGRPVRHFCYPYGEYLPSHVDMVRSVGFESATTTQRGRCHAGRNMLKLARVPVMRSTNWFQMWLKVQTAYEDKKCETAAA